MNVWNTIYFNPSNIFLARDVYQLRNKHGPVTICIEGGRGWRCYNSETIEQIIDGLDVWSMCRWLNDNATEYKDAGNAPV